MKTQWKIVKENPSHQDVVEQVNFLTKEVKEMTKNDKNRLRRLREVETKFNNLMKEFNGDNTSELRREVAQLKKKVAQLEKR